jgi:hypothetical protein
MTIKNLLLITLGIAIGVVITAAIMFSQIKNRYTMGVNTGYIQGGLTVIEFITKNINNDTQGKKVTELNTFLHHKASTLSVIEINGVKTISVR